MVAERHLNWGWTNSNYSFGHISILIKCGHLGYIFSCSLKYSHWKGFKIMQRLLTDCYDVDTLNLCLIGRTPRVYGGCKIRCTLCNYWTLGRFIQIGSVHFPFLYKPGWTKPFLLFIHLHPTKLENSKLIIT